MTFFFKKKRREKENGLIQEGEELMLGHVYLFVIKEKKKSMDMLVERAFILTLISFLSPQCTA